MDTESDSELTTDDKEYIVSVPFSGYSRGYDLFKVTASSEEQACERVFNGDYVFLERDIFRDDTESVWSDAEAEVML